jgi:hypothetical protein
MSGGGPFVIRPKSVWRGIFPLLVVTFLAMGVTGDPPVFVALGALCALATWSAWRCRLLVVGDACELRRPPWGTLRIRLSPDTAWYVERSWFGPYTVRRLWIGSGSSPAISVQLWFWEDVDRLTDVLREASEVSPGGSPQS